MVNEFARVAADFPDPFHLLVRESVGSTNDEVRELARNGAREGLVLLAETQTAGRGRRGAAWFSPPGKSLAFSVLLRPPEERALWPRLALAAGLSVVEAIESFGLCAGIKWPNDVWIGHRKVAGILSESGPDFVVIGIGLNVKNTEFPAEVAEIATSMEADGDLDLSPADVLSAIVKRLALRRTQIGTDYAALISAVQKWCILTGKHVTLRTAGGTKSGLVEGIAAGGELLLRTESGLEKLFQADEVRVS